VKIKKIKGTYNDYQVEMSFGQLEAMRNALAADHADPLADELYAELTWYLDNIPGPGESEEDIKAAEDAEESGMADKEAGEGRPVKPSADDLLPKPGEEPVGPGAPPEEGPEEGPGGGIGPEEVPSPRELLRGGPEGLPAPPAE